MNVLCIKCVNIIVLKPFCVNFLHCSRQMTSCWWLSLWKRRSCRRWLRCLRKSWSCLPHLHAASLQKMAKKGKTMQVSRCVRPAAVVHSGQDQSLHSLILLFHSFSLWRRDNSSSSPSCLSVSILASHSRNARLNPLHPTTNHFVQEHAPRLSDWADHAHNHRSPAHPAHS